MSVFQMYLKIGIEHIADFKSYDHILFIIALCVVYPIKQWSKILILITAFTIGHSTTLVLATLNIIKVDSQIIEFLIPATIFISAFANLFQKSDNFSSNLHRFKYLLALFFGLIHGLGFSNYLSSLLGNETNIIYPLLAFNIGIEIGQILIIIAITALSLLVIDLSGAKRREWILIWSGAAIGIASVLILDRFPW